MHINSKFHSLHVHSNSMDEGIVVQGVEITITGMEILHTNEIVSNTSLNELLNEYYSSSSENFIILLIKAEINNTNESRTSFDLTTLHLESGAYSSQAFYPLMQYYNKTGMTLELNGLEKKNTTLAFPIHKVSFRENDWANIENREFELVVSLFPQKEIIPLRF